MGYIYTTVPFNQSSRIRYGNSQDTLSLANVLEPNGTYGDLNVIKKFNWTYTPLYGEAIKEVPYIRLNEYYLTDSYLNQLFKAYGKTTSGVTNAAFALLNPFTLQGDSDQLYQGLYDHLYYTGFTYTFPYFNTEYLNTNNSWNAKPMFQEIINLQKKVVGYSTAISTTVGVGAINFLLNLFQITSPLDPLDAAKRSKALSERVFAIEKLQETLGIGFESPIASMQDPAIDKPHIWSTTTPRSFQIMFPLYNTLTQPDSSKWYNEIIKNWELCHLLCFQNLYNKRNLFTGLPPVFYEIDIPGIHYSKAGYVSNLEILNVGNIRKLNLPLEGGNRDVNVPDAYMINMTITDFFIPSKNFMSSLCQKNKGNLTQSGFNYTPVDSSDPDSTIQPISPGVYPGSGGITPPPPGLPDTIPPFPGLVPIQPED